MQYVVFPDFFVKSDKIPEIKYKLKIVLIFPLPEESYCQTLLARRGGWTLIVDRSFKTIESLTGGIK